MNSLDMGTQLHEILQALQYVQEQTEQNQEALRQLEKREQFINGVQGVQQQIFDRLDCCSVSSYTSQILQQSVVERERFRKDSQVVLAQARSELEQRGKKLASHQDELEQLLSMAALV